MFISRKRKGYGWYSKITTKDMGGNELTAYIDFVFKKECEPTNLNEYGSLEGELIFRAKDGTERKVFPRVKNYNYQNYIEYMLLEETQPNIQKGYENTNQNGIEQYDSKVDIEMDSLPFY